MLSVFRFTGFNTFLVANAGKRSKSFLIIFKLVPSFDFTFAHHFIDHLNKIVFFEGIFSTFSWKWTVFDSGTDYLRKIQILNACCYFQLPNFFAIFSCEVLFYRLPSVLGWGPENDANRTGSESISLSPHRSGDVGQSGSHFSPSPSYTSSSTSSFFSLLSSNASTDDIVSSARSRAFDRPTVDYVDLLPVLINLMKGFIGMF